MLDPGKTLPSFSAPDQDGKLIHSDEWTGRWTVLWWYAKADTPG
jgi:peroxiredoxin